MTLTLRHLPHRYALGPYVLRARRSVHVRVGAWVAVIKWGRG